jgi:hypothetical protein
VITFTAVIPTENCLDGVDNDFDGLVDLSDPECAPYFPKITVNKVLINDNGGAKTSPANFSFKINNGSPIAFEADGSNVVTLNVGTYTIVEVADAEYATSYTDCTNISLLAGDNKICTITNNDIQNLPPVLSGVPTTVTIPEMVLYTFTATATDPESDPLTFSLTGTVPTGASITSGGIFTWTPTEAQGPGVYSFTVRVSDNHGNNTDAAISITVDEVNIAPTADSKSVTTQEDTARDITLTGSDSDGPTAQTLSFSVVSGPSNGVLSGTAPNLTYTPNPNYNGSDSFTYTAYDGVVLSAPALVSITVSPVNDAPTLASLTDQTVDELSPVTFTAVGSDVDTGTTLTYSLSGNPSGSSIDSSTGVFTWTPSEAQGPNDYTFNVTVSDGTLSDTRSVTIHVTEVNVAPVASDATVSTHLDTSVNITLSGNDSDLPSNPLTYTIVSDPTNGTLVLSSGHTYTYTPNSGYTGPDSFTFKVKDGALDSNTATVSISVNNDAPVINQEGDKSVDEGTNLSFTATATDPNEDTLTYSLTGVVADGASISSGGVFTWTPTEAQGPGVYSFTISVTDGGATDSTTFEVTVNEVNATPKSDNKTLTLDEDTSADVTLSGSDSDIPAQTLTFSKITEPLHGTATLVGNVVTYTPNPNYNGSDSFTYSAHDGVAYSIPADVATVSITVTPVNDAPTIVLTGSDNVAVVFEGTYTELGAVCSDVDEEGLITSITGTVNTSVAGSYTITYTCTDAGKLSASTTRTVVVQAAPAQCNDGKDNDGDEKTDMQDPGCSSIDDNDETDPVIVVSGGGGGGHGGHPVFTSAPTGQVLGATASCGIYVDKFLRKGYKNNVEAVKKLQKFLNDFTKAGLKEDGKFGGGTEKALKKFQSDHYATVIAPWVKFNKTKGATGIFYQTTQTEVNNIMCPDLKLPIPTLIPIEKHPDAPKKV